MDKNDETPYKDTEKSVDISKLMYAGNMNVGFSLALAGDN